MTTVFDIDKIEDILQCSICLDRFKNPKVLPCQHTFCFSCLEKIFNRSHENFHCPHCRKTVTIVKDLHELPTNVTVSNLLDLQPIQAKCLSCGSVGSLKFCKCCQVAKCFACSEKHSKETIDAVKNAMEQLSNTSSKNFTDVVNEQFQSVRSEILTHFQKFRQEIDSLLLEKQAAVVRQLDQYQNQVLKRIHDDVRQLERSRRDLISEKSKLESKEQTELQQILKKMLQLQNDLDEKLTRHQENLNGIDVTLQYDPKSLEGIKAFVDAFKLEINRKPQSNGDEREQNNLSTDQNKSFVITTRTLMNQEYKIEISLDATVKQLKELVSAQIKIDTKKIVLTKPENFFDGLDDNKTLHFYNCNSSTVLIISIL